jgi:hypothetical protein
VHGREHVRISDQLVHEHQANTSSPENSLATRAFFPRTDRTMFPFTFALSSDPSRHKRLKYNFPNTTAQFSYDAGRTRDGAEGRREGTAESAARGHWGEKSASQAPHSARVSGWRRLSVDGCGGGLAGGVEQRPWPEQVSCSVSVSFLYARISAAGLNQLSF